MFRWFMEAIVGCNNGKVSELDLGDRHTIDTIDLYTFGQSIQLCQLRPFFVQFYYSNISVAIILLFQLVFLSLDLIRQRAYIE